MTSQEPLALKSEPTRAANPIEPTPSVLIPVTNHRDLVFDGSRNVLYITTAAGTVERWDVASQARLSAFTVSTSLNGADITADGSSLYVSDDPGSAGGGIVQQNT